MTFAKTALAASTAIIVSLGSAASAQVAAEPPRGGDTVFDDTYATVGIGGSYSPSYDGSDDYTFSVLPVITGSIDGITFSPRGPGFAVDVVKDKPGAKVDFILGPVITVSFDRVNDIEDPVVELLGELDTAVEVGPSVGVKVNRLINPFDSLTFAVDTKWDIAGAHNGMTVQPSLTYFTPVSRGAAVSLAFSAEHIDDDNAEYYYSIDAAGSAASGLPIYQATGGWKSAGVTLFGAVDLDGDITNGGFGAFFIGGYSKLLEDAKRSPIVAIRGNDDQLFGALGIGYTF